MLTWATAFVPALVNSGLPNDKFIFEGFLPKKGRQTRFELAEETRTMILYVSP
jgi:16S rRNA (cytidine1402-2'-O)-methyltransferase